MARHSTKTSSAKKIRGAVGEMPVPLVSVIIPAWNAEKFIAETLESVFAQTWRRFEVIVVDDGSTDGTSQAVRACAKAKAAGPVALKLIRQQNGGPSSARNAGLRAASGDYLAFLDADDRWFPETLERLVGFAEAHSNVSLVFGDAGSFDEDGTRFDSFFKKYGRPATDERGIVINALEKLLKGNFILTGALLLRRECIDHVGYFDEKISHGEDYDLWIRITLLHAIGCISDRLMMRRIHESNLSLSQTDFYDAKIYSLKKLKKLFGSEIKQQSIDLNSHILNTMRTKAYLLYLRKEYAASAKASWFLMMSYFRNTSPNANIAG
jgi:glycosyltransferase involved in cell wall biosynthesis